jgi:hypothetical protein
LEANLIRIVVIVGLRFYYIKKSNLADLTHGPELSSVELYLGIISACLPFLAAPLSKIWENLSFSFHGSFTWVTGTSRSNGGMNESGSSFKTRDAVELSSNTPSQEELGHLGSRSLVYTN